MTISKAAERKQLLDRMDVLEQRLEQQENFGELVGSTAGMREVYRLALGVAPTSATVLILGESGTGKELIARAIHQHSNRTDRPFLAVNCSAIPFDLVESELFGHTRARVYVAVNARVSASSAADKARFFSTRSWTCRRSLA
jgi:two-component system NtrC family response regulator